MKYVLTGGAGHITKPVAQKLLKAGHEVTVISRNADNLKELTDLGAKAAIGSVEDVNFLIKGFAGADAVYTMVPPDFGVKEMKNHIEQIGKNYTAAIKANNIKYVVNLSSIGADKPDGVGPVSGLHRAENALNTLTDTNIKHLRPGYFFNNLFANIDLVKKFNITGSNFRGDSKLILADTDDIADVVAEELLGLKFKGHTVRYIASDERDPNDIAKVLGTAVGKPGVPWVVFSDDDALAGMLQSGLPEEIAKNYVEMGNAIHTGYMFEDYWKHRPVLGKIKLEDFATRFKAAYVG
jgi:uncharacterized protein YbjT (DUF2867 family)